MQLDWDHVYLLGYYTPEGESRLTSWYGEMPYVTVAVTGEYPPPLWASAVGRAVLHAIPDGQDPKQYAASIGGVHAFGWYYEKGFERNPPIEKGPALSPEFYKQAFEQGVVIVRSDNGRESQ